MRETAITDIKAAGSENKFLNRKLRRRCWIFGISVDLAFAIRAQGTLRGDDFKPCKLTAHHHHWQEASHPWLTIYFADIEYARLVSAALTIPKTLLNISPCAMTGARNRKRGQDRAWAEGFGISGPERSRGRDPRRDQHAGQAGQATLTRNRGRRLASSETFGLLPSKRNIQTIIRLVHQGTARCEQGSLKRFPDDTGVYSRSIIIRSIKLGISSPISPRQESHEVECGKWVGHAIEMIAVSVINALRARK